MNRQRLLSLLIIIPGTLWGFSFGVNEIILETLPPTSIVISRSALAIIPLGLAMWWRGGSLPRTLREWWPFVLLGALNNSIPFVLIAWAQLTIDSSLATVLSSMMPLFTLLIAVWIGDEVLNRPKVIGSIVGFVGVVLLIGPAALNGLGRNLIAQLMIVMATISYAIAAIYARRVMERLAMPNPIDAILTLTVSQYITSTLTLLPFFLIIDRPWTLQPNSTTWIGIVVLAWPITVGAVLIYYYLIARVGATIGAMTVYIIPVVGILVGVFALGESLAWQTVAALGLIFAGIALVNGFSFGRRAAKAVG